MGSPEDGGPEIQGGVTLDPGGSLTLVVSKSDVDVEPDTQYTYIKTHCKNDKKLQNNKGEAQKTSVTLGLSVFVTKS